MYIYMTESFHDEYLKTTLVFGDCHVVTVSPLTYILSHMLETSTRLLCDLLLAQVLYVYIHTYIYHLHVQSPQEVSSV